MALVNSAFTVNVTPGAMPPIVHVSEYDVGRTYTVTINGENGSAFNIPTGTTATVEGTLNGSVGFTQSATISNNQVSFALSESMTAYSGKAWCKIKLTLNSEPIQTCAFILAADRAGVEADTVIGAPGFEKQIENAVEDYLNDFAIDDEVVKDAVDDYLDKNGVDPEAIASNVTDWLDANVNPVGSAVVVDSSLSVSGAAADAKATGDITNRIAEDIDLNSGGNQNMMPAIKPGFYASSDGAYNGTRRDYVCSADLFPVQEGDVLSLVGDINYNGWYLNKFAADGTYISSQSYAKTTKSVTIPSGVGLVGLSFNFGTAADRTIDDVPAVYINYDPYAQPHRTVAERLDALEENESGSTSELFDYSPINFTAAAGWRGNAIYSTNSHYHVDIPVQEGEKFHIKTRTDNASMYAVGYFPNNSFNSITKALDGAASGFVEGYITVPAGAAYLTVNCAKAYSVVIEKYGLKADAETGLPTYFADEVDSVVATTKGHCTEKSLVFAVVTDTHLNATYGYQVWNDTIKNIAAVNAKYPLDGVIHMGDIINGDAASSVGMEQLDKARSDFLSISKNAVFLEGNHDLNSFYNSNADPINEASMFSEVFRFNDTEIVRPNGKLYGYRDYDALGIRVVYLHSSMGDGTHGGRGDNWGYPSDELTWVQNVALDMEYQVLFISHMPMTQGYVSDASTIPTNGDALKTIVSDFIDNGGVVIGLFHGHTHWDDLQDNGKFKEVSVGCEDYTYTPNDVVGTAIHSYTPATAVKPARMRYTVTQDLWDVVIVRPASRTVKLVRFGAGADRAFSY